MTEFDNALAAGDSAVAAKSAFNEAFESAKIQWDALVAKNAEINGGVIPSDVQTLIKKYGPKIAMLVGGPAAGAAVTAGVADGGAFDGLAGVLGSLLGLFGLG